MHEALELDDASAQLLSRQALFRKGIIGAWYLREYQEPLYALLYNTMRDIVVPNICRRYGKSTVCVVYAIEQAIRKKQDIRYATAFRTDLENFIEPIFDSVLADCPDDMRPKWIASRKLFKFPNGSRIKLVGLDKNPNGVRGNALDIVLIDEAAFVANLEYIYRSILIPATARRKFKLVFPSTPPVSPEHFWAKELIVKAKMRGTYLEATLDDVTDMDEAEKERLLSEVGGRHTVTARREFFCCILADATRAVAPEFVYARHVGRYEGDESFIKWAFIGDTGGVRDKTAIFKAGYSHDLKKVVIRSELTFEPKTPTPKITAQYKLWANGGNIDAEAPPLIIDAPGQTLVDIAEFGLRASLPIKDEFAAGIQQLNAALYNDAILIDPDCILLITTLTAGLLTKNQTDFERTITLGHCDAAAALIYTLRHIDKVTDLRPAPKASQVWAANAKTGKTRTDLKRAFL